jgi:hypothetical protein
MENIWFSHLNIDKCVDCLKSSVNNQLRLYGNSGGNIAGKIKGYKFQIWKRPIEYRNSFSPIFFGNLISDGTGTRITGHFGIVSAVKGTLYFMYGLIIAMGLVIYIVALTNWIPGTENHDYIPPLLYALPFLALLVLYGFSKILMLLGKNEQKYIIDFLETTLEAHKQT